jgi:hypothetical protein
MLPTPRLKEIDHRTMKLIVGVVAITLPALTTLFAKGPLTSISASYWEGGPSQSIFIGFLFAIGSFLLAYNGYSRHEMILSKVASIASLGIALFPCQCDQPAGGVPDIHFASAATMFLILAFFCYSFYRRAKAKGHAEANIRATIYVVCGVAIVLSILVLALNAVLGGPLAARLPRLTFYGETTGLIAFGISWLIASRTLPAVTRADERFSPLKENNPA